MAAPVTHLNPAALPQNPGFSQGVAVDGPVRTVYVGGQNAVRNGTVVGDTLATQTAVALGNLALVLREAGATLGDVVTWSILVVGDADLRPAFASFQQAWGESGPPPAITVARVLGLADPQFLVEISATAARPL